MPKEQSQHILPCDTPQKTPTRTGFANVLRLVLCTQPRSDLLMPNAVAHRPCEVLDAKNHLMQVISLT